MLTEDSPGVAGEDLSQRFPGVEEYSRNIELMGILFFCLTSKKFVYGHRSPFDSI